MAEKIKVLITEEEVDARTVNSEKRSVKSMKESRSI